MSFKIKCNNCGHLAMQNIKTGKGEVKTMALTGLITSHPMFLFMLIGIIFIAANLHSKEKKTITPKTPASNFLSDKKTISKPVKQIDTEYTLDIKLDSAVKYLKKIEFKHEKIEKDYNIPDNKLLFLSKKMRIDKKGKKILHPPWVIFSITPNKDVSRLYLSLEILDFDTNYWSKIKERAMKKFNNDKVKVDKYLGKEGWNEQRNYIINSAKKEFDRLQEDANPILCKLYPKGSEQIKSFLKEIHNQGFDKFFDKKSGRIKKYSKKYKNFIISISLLSQGFLISIIP